MTMAKYAFVQLKNGHTSRIPCEFCTEDEKTNHIELWGEVGRVAIFSKDTIDYFTITEKKENNNDKD